MGIFSGFELNRKHSGSDQKVLSPAYGKRGRTNSFDDQDIAQEKKPLGGIFTNNKKPESVKGNTTSLSGIFGNRKLTPTQILPSKSRASAGPFSKIKIERGQKQNSVDDVARDDTPAFHNGGSQSAKKQLSATLLDQKPKRNSSPSPNDTIKLELDTKCEEIEVESPDEPLVPLSQNRGNTKRIKESDELSYEIENDVEADPEAAPIIDQEASKESSLKRKIEETSIIKDDWEEDSESLKR